MTLLQILILAIVQGAAELLPVSSSAHVIVAEKLMGLDPTAPQMTLLLVMLHTGTMFAVIVYFWKSWRAAYFSSMPAFRATAVQVVIATALTGVVGLALLRAIRYLVAGDSPAFEIEHLFGSAKVMAAALAAAGILIIASSRDAKRADGELSPGRAAWIGAIQGVCLPFRGFSRSGATISVGLLLGVGRRRAEEFSFALAVVLTPPVIAKEAYRLVQAMGASGAGALLHSAAPGLLGMVLSFVAGLLALKWLTRWLEQGRWHFFGVYCLAAAPFVLWIG
ncbi:MAG: undecaprenyl-diphosphate phosphatase [Burkholderiaceae bacterium]|nr:undecaprenyl-diphosphate phosphatase [Burkholderiaceae bacterium]